MTKPLSTNNAAFITKGMVREVRKVQARMEAQTLEILMIIAQNPDISQKQITEQVGITLSAIGRNLDLLGDGSTRSSGLGLIIRYDDPVDRRTKRCKLTKAGQAWLEEYTEALAAILEKARQ